MAERKKSAEVEVTDPIVKAVDDLPEEVKEDNFNPELAEHVKNLVHLYFGEVVQEFEQRIRDLELLVAQPVGAVQFGAPQQPPVGESAGVPWYQPKI